MMTTLMNGMALFWALAEIWILLFLIRGIATAGGKAVDLRRYSAIFVASAITATAFAFEGTTIAAKLLQLNSPLAAYFYQYAQWHFFCTFWVVLEGVIMILVFRIHSMLKNSLRHASTTLPVPGCSAAVARILTTALILCFFAFFVIYEYQTWSLMRSVPFSLYQLNRISTFFINICGFFWVVFDGVVALLGLKTFKLIRNKSFRENYASASAVG
jgi:hypothetical protein